MAVPRASHRFAVYPRECGNIRAGRRKFCLWKKATAAAPRRTYAAAGAATFDGSRARLKGRGPARPTGPSALRVLHGAISQLLRLWRTEELRDRRSLARFEPIVAVDGSVPLRVWF